MKPLPKFIPVIHVTSDAQAIRQTNVAFDNGAGGVFLIDHGRPHPQLLRTYHAIRERFHSEWIGLNFLDLGGVEATRYIPADADGLWLDNPSGLCDRFLDRLRNWRVFAGAAFKYQRQGTDPGKEAAMVASNFSKDDVITTSGPATGRAASRTKVEEMRLAIPGRKLALASGVSIDNVVNYLPLVDCFMVASAISLGFDALDPVKVHELATAISIIDL